MPPILAVSGLTYTYPKTAAPALRHLNFHIEPGEIFGFLGPSGAGKSTSQKILIGLLRGYQGSVTAFGRPLQAWQSDYYERIGISFEAPTHFLKLTGLENLTYFAALYAGRTRDPRELLAQVGLANDSGAFVSQYSKGMKNRLSVARALLNDPELVFLDEPTAGLDPVNARSIRELIKAQKQADKTIFLTTHDMTVADELCDRVAFIVDGEIRLVDRPRDLKLRYGAPRVRVEYLDGGIATAAQEFALEGLGRNAAFQALLQSDRVQTIHTLEATLEDVFIQVTGRVLA